MNEAPSPESGPDAVAGKPKNPWWIPPFLGRVPALPESQIRMLGVIALALLFESYDQSMLTAALKHIAEDFGVQESELGRLLGTVHLGAVWAFVLIPFADRIGRRRLFLISLIGLSLGTVASGFAQSITQFVICQMIARTFMVTCSATAFVIVTEELDAEHRGWGIGILGALGSFGYGLGLILFSGIEWLPYGWRALYVVGMVPLLLMPWFRSQVKETARFQRHREGLAREGDSSGLLEGWLRPFFGLMREYPGRAISIGVIGALASAGHAAGFNFTAYHVLTVHGWEPGEYSLMAVLAGTFGIVGHPFAGRIADRRGRRIVGFVLLAAFPLLGIAFYQGPGWSLPIIWIPMIFTLTGGSTIMRALATELFPTSHRGTSSGWLQLVEALGRSGGLYLVYWGTAEGGSNIPMISIVVFGSLLAGLVVLSLPETSSRELEEISQEH